MTKFNRAIGLLSVGALSVAAFAYQAATRQLEENGTVISSNLAYENGQYLIPVTDVAKYFGYQFKVTNGVGEFTKTDPLNTRSQVFGGTSAVAPPGAPTSTDLTPAPSAPGDAMPTTVVPNTAITTATSNLFPDSAQAPTKIDTTVGKSTSVNGLDYKIESIQDAGKQYKDQFDQRGTIVHPAWKTDTLEVIDISVTNTSNSPTNVYAPGTGDVTVFNSEKIGIPSIGMDIRQSPDSLNSDSSYDIAGMGGSTNLMLGPGGTLHYAVIASVPKDDRISSLLVNVPASSGGTMSGATITVDR